MKYELFKFQIRLRFTENLRGLFEKILKRIKSLEETSKKKLIGMTMKKLIKN